MLKKSLAWVLTVALLLSTLSGLALISSAATDAKFALASYQSGAPLYKNATQNLDSVTAKGGSTYMPEITGNADDEYAYHMPQQNDQLGMNIPASTGIGSNAIIEITFWADVDNQSNTRLGVNYTSASGQTDYGALVMEGANGAELISSSLDGATGEIIGTSGWQVLKITVTDADFNNNGQVNIVKWNHNNSNDNPDGWYIKSILVYDASEGAPVPDADDLYIRYDTIGYLDFSAEEAYTELLSYTADGAASEVMDDEMSALKLSNKALTVTADDAKQPAVVATDAEVSVLAEVKVGDGDWQVMRKDITDNAGTSFDLATLLFGETEGDIYVRKVMVARTNLVATYTNDSAFVDFEDPYALYNDFQNVLYTDWLFTWDFEGGAEENYEIKSDGGQNAIYANGGYWRLNVDDAFTKYNSTDIADMAIEITYLDKGTGTLKIQYNTVLPEDAEDPIPYNFKNLDVATLEDSGEWKTVTVYLSDAQFRNAANGADFRIPMGDLAGAGVSSVKVTIGADKTALNEWINKAVNSSKYTPESLEGYNAAKNAAITVRDNLYATKEQVDTAVANMSTAFDALVVKDGGDPRYVLDGAMWDSSTSDGEIMILDGWYCWQFPSNQGNKWIRIGDENGILKDSTSVTYEYEIFMDSSNGNDRCFLAHGTTDGLKEVIEGAPPAGTGFAVGGQWGKVPAAGRWGWIQLVNDNFDPNALLTGNNITGLGSWFENGTLYVRAIKVYDTEDPTKCISLQFKEDVAELIVEGGDADVALTEKDGSEAYVIPSGWKALNINVPSLLEQNVVSEDTQYAMIEFEYFLEDTDNGNELLMIKHYNPDGTGQNGDKSAVCEHQLNHTQLTKRNQWTRAKFLLDDCLFGADDKTLNITYGNGSNIYIRGVKVYETDENGEMTSEKPAQWGVFEIPAVVSDFAFYDWDTEQSYGMAVSFSEGLTATEVKAIDGRVAAIITDDMMYVNVEEEMISADQKFVRIDIHHEMGTVMYARYNKIVDEGIDTSAEPYLTQYNFHASGENEIINEEGANAWATTEDDFVNMLGVVKPTEDSADWTVTSIYLNDANFRNAANGSDFRIHIVGGGAIVSRVEVHAITEEEYNTAKAAVGDMSALKALYNETVEKYGDEMPDAIDYALEDAQYFMDFGYRASQEAIDEALAALKAAVEEAAVTLGDVNGDGKINTSDARVILQYAAGIEAAADIDTAAADVTKDGKVNTSDARKILQFAAGIVTEL